MNWISVKERLPEKGCAVLVLSLIEWIGPTETIYCPKYKTFVYYDPKMHEKLMLEATHWTEIPAVPKQQT